MADYMGAQTFAPQYPYYSQVPPGMGWPQQQQPMVGQMGTRGVGVEQEQPLSPGGFQGQVGPQQGHGVPQSVNLLPHEKVALKGVLDILKEGRMAMASEALDGLSAQRLTAAHAYLSGFLEAKGLGELGSFIKTIPPPATRGGITDGRYDQMLNNLEGILNDSPETRFWGVAARVAGQIIISGAGSALWDATKTAYKRIRR
jgi:hypothetical protein